MSSMNHMVIHWNHHGALVCRDPTKNARVHSQIALRSFATFPACPQSFNCLEPNDTIILLMFQTLHILYERGRYLGSRKNRNMITLCKQTTN
ncbi:hypothetical protein HanPI659440_Chr07g0257451 [Helianthus annuus]|nr:hypothetical protein HanPI659440_Chr07g0257451 [Helianthus annuus]